MSSNPVTGSQHSLLSRARVIGALTATLAAMPLATAGCDSTAKIFPQLIFFDRAMIVSSFPAKKDATGHWVRECSDASTNGIITNVALISTQRKEGSTDQDLSIRPLDVVDGRTVEGSLPDDINLTNEGNTQLNVDCIDAQPHPDLSGGACQGATNPSFDLDEVHYAANNAARGDGHNVLILIDFSGSMIGFVDPARNNVEAKPGTFDPPNLLQPLASDFQNARLAAVKRLIRTLNPNDRIGVLIFGESFANRLVVPCSLAQGDLQNDLNTCFGKADTNIWLGSEGIDKYGSGGGGRSTLWEAVDFAHDFLTALDDRKRGNHILVISDGPDTCVSGENATACESACSTTTSDEVINKIDANINNPNQRPVRVHFVQFESIGYAGRDPRQLEAACLSGGQYQYINSNVFPRTSGAQFSEAIETAVLNVRFMLSGHWEFASGVPAYADSGPTGTRLGSLYALNGRLTLRPATNLVIRDTDFPFGIGQGKQAESATQWDRRPTLRKPCSAATDCGAAGPGGSCSIICSPETLVCPGGAAGVTAHDTSACTTGGGTQGFCCEGTCEPLGGVCSACTGN